MHFSGTHIQKTPLCRRRMASTFCQRLHEERIIKDKGIMKHVKEQNGWWDREAGTTATNCLPPAM